MTTFTDFLAVKQRNKLKKEVRKVKPNLYGQALDREVDRVMGISRSDKMDWAAISAITTPPSDYPTPESVIPHVEGVAQEFGIRSWVLWWFYKKKIYSLDASGRSKNNYLSLLRDIATKTKNLDETEKVQAIMLFSKEIDGKEMTPDEALFIVQKNNL